MKPWLTKDKWKDNRILSQTKSTLYIIWAFSILWNGLTFPAIIFDDEIWRKAEAEPVTYFFLLFPVIGLFIFYTAIKELLKWKKYGAIPLVLDPFPGSIGGHVGGEIDVGIPYTREQRFKVVLSCVKSYTTGTGSDRKRQERPVWQNEGICHTKMSAKGTKVAFRFDVPEGLPESDTDKKDQYISWRAHIVAVDNESEFDRAYVIPVFRTSEESRSHNFSTEEHVDTVREAEEGVNSIVDIQPIAGGISLNFPSLTRNRLGIVFSLVGLIFSVASAFIFMSGDIFPAILCFFAGDTIMLLGIYQLFKSLKVTVTKEGITSRRFLFGYPITTKEIQKQDLVGVNIIESGSMQTGNETTVIYKIYAENTDRRRAVLAERIHKRSEAEMLLETINTYLGKSI